MCPMAQASAMEPAHNNNGRMRQRRSDYADLGCIPPEETYDYFNPELDDDDTVVMGNLDHRPKHIGNLEKSRSLSAITQEEKDARDRQLIQMYPRPKVEERKQKTKSKSLPQLPSRKGTDDPHLQSPQQARPESSSSRSLMSSSRSVTSQTTEQFHRNHYYDLVVTEPSQVFDDVPKSISESSRVKGDAPSSAATIHSTTWNYEVISPPFSPHTLKNRVGNQQSSRSTTWPHDVILPPFSPHKLKDRVGNQQSSRSTTWQHDVILPPLSPHKLKNKGGHQQSSRSTKCHHEVILPPFSPHTLKNRVGRNQQSRVWENDETRAVRVNWRGGEPV